MPETQRPRMRGYGVPDDPEGTLPWSWAEERLVSSRNYWLATVDPQNNRAQGDRPVEDYAAKYERDPAARARLADFFLQGAVFRSTPMRAFGMIERPDDLAERATRWVW